MQDDGKGRVAYIDTNIALDCATGRNIETVLLIERLKEDGWTICSSVFLTMEMADYKKDSLFITDRVINKKWEMRKVQREMYKKSLRASDFEEVEEWLNDFDKRYKIDYYNFLNEKEGWDLCQQISYRYCLTAPDVLHLSSAILGNFAKTVDIVITGDEELRKIGKIVVEELKDQNTQFPPLKIMSVPEVKQEFLAKNVAVLIGSKSGFGKN